MLPADHGQMAANSQNIRNLVNVIGKLKHLSEESVERQNSEGRDLDEFALQLKTLSTLHVEQNQTSVQNWVEMQRGFAAVSR